MSLNFTKVTYVDGETVIGADNLNDMQDAILDLDENKVEKEQGKGLSTNDFTDTDKQKVDDAYVVPEGGIPKSALSDAVQTSLDNADTALQEDDLEDLTEEVDDLKSAINFFDDIPGTVQTVNFDANGNPSSIVHTANGEAVRTDSFTWGVNTVTEKRELADGSYITFVTDLTTLVTTISEIQEA